jgi:hypothetical protein
MTVYVDDARTPAAVGGRAARLSHLTADTRAELAAFARSIGLRPGWLQDKPDRRTGAPGRYWHYDVTDSKRAAAIADGAVAIDVREMGQLIAARKTTP